MLEYDFRSDLGYWVHMTAHRFEWAMNAQLAESGITYRQYQILAWLAIEGDQPQVELAQHMNVQPSTITKALDRMQRDGLIERTPCPEDRRKWIIKPTRKAIPVWNRIIECAETVKARSVRGLSEKEIATLRKLLVRVRDNIEVES